MISFFDLLLAYGRAQSNATRLRKSSYNVAEDPSLGLCPEE
ncbi:hypothetical protein QP919_05975 [Corynebacterium propinquum]|nr:hypothetical protein [Corynebacterium propinquum]MDK8722941.1 hypothetical protein [Corynebacterium propinquum]